MHQSHRKFLKAIDLINMLKTLQSSRILAGTLLTSQQKLMMKFQRENVVESQDITESSDNLEEIFYEPQTDRGVKVFAAVGKVIEKFSEQSELTEMDRRLLKGFYTTNRNALGNPSITLPPKTVSATQDGP